jgi:hypothetical protein
VREYVVDVTQATSWQDVIAAFNEGFIRHVGGEWSGNLDAFNDYLWWPDEHPYRLVIRGWAACAHAVNTYKTWNSRPVWEVLTEIFRDNPQTDVVLV